MEVPYYRTDMRHHPQLYYSGPLLPPHCYEVSPYHPCIIRPLPLYVGHRSSHADVSSSFPPKHATDVEHIPVRWALSKHDTVKLNFDGGVSNNKAGCGYIVRDECGSILLAGCNMVVKNSVIAAELSGALNGLKKLVEYYPCMKKIWIEGDSAIAISFLQRFNPVEMTSWPILQEIQKLLQHFEVVDFSHIYREGNQSVDYWAGLGKEKQCSLFWTVGYPVQLLRFAQRDITMVFVREKKK